MNFKRKLYVSWLHLFRGPPLSGGGEPGHIYLFTKLMESLIGFTIGQADAVYFHHALWPFIYLTHFFSTKIIISKKTPAPPVC